MLTDLIAINLTLDSSFEMITKITANTAYSNNSKINFHKKTRKNIFGSKQTNIKKNYDSILPYFSAQIPSNCSKLLPLVSIIYFLVKKIRKIIKAMKIT